MLCDHKMTCPLTVSTSGIVLTAALAFFAQGQPARAQEEDLKRKFLEEYTPAAARLESFYFRIQLTETQTGPEARPGGKQVRRYLSNGKSMRIERLGPAGAVQRAAVNTPKERFHVDKGGGRGGYHYTKVNSESYEENLELARNASVKLPFAPYCILEMRIVDFLALPECTVTRLEEVTRAEKKLVKVSWERLIQKTGAKSPGWFLFSPEDSWALLEYQYGTGRRRCAIQYGEKVDSVPVIQRAEYWKEETGERTPMLVAEATDVKLEPAPEEYFSAASFGLTPVLEVQERSWSWQWPVAGICGLILAALLAYWARRRRLAAAG